MKEGDYVYCRACSGESRLHKPGETTQLNMTGQMDDASVLAPDNDTDIIGSMVEAIASNVF